MNTKPIPAILALIAGFVTCIMSFVQHMDVVLFAKRFILVCIVFYIIGTVISIVININFKDMAAEDEYDEFDEESPEEEDIFDMLENIEAAEGDEG